MLICFLYLFVSIQVSAAYVRGFVYYCVLWRLILHKLIFVEVSGHSVPLCNQETKTFVHRHDTCIAKYMRSFQNSDPDTPWLNGAAKTVTRLNCIHLVANYNLQYQSDWSFW
jgi:hypothetical protein